MGAVHGAAGKRAALFPPAHIRFFLLRTVRHRFVGFFPQKEATLRGQNDYFEGENNDFQGTE